MRVKYWKSCVLTASNATFELRLSTKIENDNSVLYDPLEVLNFLDTSFLSAPVPTSLNVEQILQVYLYPGCITVKEQKVYIDINGLKYFFSALVSSRVAQYDNFDVLDPKQSKFINWVLKFDFDKFVLKSPWITR